MPDDAPLHEGDAKWLSIPRDPLLLMKSMEFYWEGRPHPHGMPIDREMVVPAEVVELLELVERSTADSQ